MADLLHPDAAFAALAEEIGEVDQADLLEVGHFALDLVLARTKQGVDVDGNSFTPYSPTYAEERTKKGLKTTPDLAVTGHMLGAFGPEVTGADEVSVRFFSPLEAEKAAAHNYGVDKSVYVGSHTRSAYVNSKTGQRASKKEVALDKKRKNKKLAQRTESVTPHQRRQHTPKREFADIRMPKELDAIAEVIGEKMMSNIDKRLK